MKFNRKINELYSYKFKIEYENVMQHQVACCISFIICYVLALL